jgi:hypothetical protein
MTIAEKLLLEELEAELLLAYQSVDFIKVKIENLKVIIEENKRKRATT